MATLNFSNAQIKTYWNAATYVPEIGSEDYMQKTFDELKAIWNNKAFAAMWPGYVAACRGAEDMRVHADGLYPWRMMDITRPNEPYEVKLYRREIFAPITKSSFGKLQSSLAKIRRSSDWAIKYPGKEDFTRIADGEYLEDYCEKKLPIYGSVTNWLFTEALRIYMIDANAVVFVQPDNPEEETEMNQPFLSIFESQYVLDYVEGDFAVLMNPYGSKYSNKSGNVVSGKRMWIVTTETISVFDQRNERGDWFLFSTTPITSGVMPCTKMGGLVVSSDGVYRVFESRISPVKVPWNKALREDSDTDASIILHMFPERWELTQNACQSCNGIGVVLNPDPEALPAQIACNSCGGLGYVGSSPYKKILVKPFDNIGGSANAIPPLPPAGYIQKDVEIIKLQKDSVRQHIADGFSAMNFDFLVEVPLAQSGVSKQYDRSESNNTTHAIAEDLVRVMDFVYAQIANYRYSKQYYPEEIAKMLPNIPVPENYDLYSVANAQKEVTDAKVGKVNPIIINAMETDYVDKRFAAEQETKTWLHLCLTLDPLSNVAEDDKMTRLANKGITLKTYVISSNITAFVQRAMEEDENFAMSTFDEQQAVLSEYADEVIADNTTTPAKLVSLNGGGLDPNEQTAPQNPNTDQNIGGPNGDVTQVQGQTDQNGNPINADLPTQVTATA